MSVLIDVADYVDDAERRPDMLPKVSNAAKVSFEDRILPDDTEPFRRRVETRPWSWSLVPVLVPRMGSSSVVC